MSAARRGSPFSSDEDDDDYDDSDAQDAPTPKNNKVAAQTNSTRSCVASCSWTIFSRLHPSAAINPLMPRQFQVRHSPSSRSNRAITMLSHRRQRCRERQHRSSSNTLLPSFEQITIAFHVSLSRLALAQICKKQNM